MNPYPVSGSRIFIVEDDMVMRYVLKRILSKTCTLTVFENGQECLRALQDGELPDLVLTDLNTPFVNGIQLTKFIKTNDRLQQIPVMIMSAGNSSDMILNCLAAGADDYLQKPFRAEDLLPAMNRVLQEACEKNGLMPV